MYCYCQSLSHVQFFATPWTATRQASLSFPVSRSLLRLISIESVMVSIHAHFSLPSIFPSIGVLSSESALHIRWSKYWNSSFRVSPLHEYSGLISFRIDSFDLSGIQGTESSPAPRFECMFVFFFSYCVLFPWWCWHCYCELKGYDIHTLAQEIFNNCCSKAGWWKVEFWRSSEQETLKGFW